jgi:hypothetical protein|tara:strand:+ start:30 stop:1055 length:1026 start_codon:yes stop_codon:yes gene_type:complete
MKIDVTLNEGNSVFDGAAYFNDAYQDLFSRYDGATRGHVRIEKEGKVFFLPFLRSKIGEDAYEIYSAYGYGGFWPKVDLNFDETIELLDALKFNKIICAFLRHSPFLANHSALLPEYIELNRYTYIRDLRADEDLLDFCAEANQKVRWSVKYALRNGLEVRFTPLCECSHAQIENFYNIYSALMLEKGDANYYLFSEEIFLQHSNGLSGELAELIMMDETGNEELYAASFFLTDNLESNVHYHLSASVHAAKKLQGMELLMAEAIVRYGAQGFAKLHLGGGHRLDEEDGLSRFKKKFSSGKIPFYCSKLISDSTRYLEERDRIPVVNKNYFLITDARGGKL